MVAWYFRISVQNTREVKGTTKQSKLISSPLDNRLGGLVYNPHIAPRIHSLPSTSFPLSCLLLPFARSGPLPSFPCWCPGNKGLPRVHSLVTNSLFPSSLLRSYTRFCTLPPFPIGMNGCIFIQKVPVSYPFKDFEPRKLNIAFLPFHHSISPVLSRYVHCRVWTRPYHCTMKILF